jgi:hypothetical protein
MGRSCLCVGFPAADLGRGRGNGCAKPGFDAQPGRINLGNAAGAWLGGVALTEGANYQQLPLLGALVAVIALTFTLTTVINSRVMPALIGPAE